MKLSAILTVFLVVAQTPGPRVELSLIVTDKANKSVDTVSKEEVRVVEDGVEQTVLGVDRDERPVDFVIAIDGSGSFRTFLPGALKAAEILIQQKRSADEVLIARFVSKDNIQNIHDFTTDTQGPVKALKSFVVEGGRSAVIDALYAAAEHVARRKPGEDRRKAVVIITDGEDRDSARNLNALVKLLREQQVQVFAIGLTGDLDQEAGFVRASPRALAEKLLTTVAEESGGRAFFPRKDEELFRDVTPQIVANLWAQFRIRYQSSNSAGKDFRKLEVKIAAPKGEKRKAVVRRGYYPLPVSVSPQPSETKTP
jgi:Ca-activated chloride channel homolog